MEEEKRKSKRVRERERVVKISRAYELLEKHLLNSSRSRSRAASQKRCHIRRSRNEILRTAISTIDFLLKQQHQPPSKVHNSTHAHVGDFPIQLRTATVDRGHSTASQFLVWPDRSVFLIAGALLSIVGLIPSIGIVYVPSHLIFQLNRHNV